MAGWSAAAIAAYLVWASLPAVLVAASILRRSRPVHFRLLLAPAAFNAIVVLLLAAWAFPRMLEIPVADGALIALPFFLYGVAGYAAILPRLRGGRGSPARTTAARRALRIYAFSFAGYLVGLTLLLGFLAARAGL